MARSKEVSVTFDLRHTTIARTVAHSEGRPETALAALMEAKPFEDPEPSMEELAPLKEALGAAFDKLSEKDRWIADSLWVRRLSVRELARELSISKSQVHRLGDQIKVKLIRALLTEPAIRRYLGD